MYKDNTILLVKEQRTETFFLKTNNRTELYIFLLYYIVVRGYAQKNLKSAIFLLVSMDISYKTFEEDTYDCMVEAGFKDIQIWWLSLSTQQGTQTQSTLEGDSIESKQKNNYIGRFARPDIPGRKYQPIFIGIK